jgi:hypothetical protein
MFSYQEGQTSRLMLVGFYLQDRNKSELMRFEEERNRDFMSMLRGLIQTQVHCHLKVVSLYHVIF